MPLFRYIAVWLIITAVSGCSVKTIPSGTYREDAGPHTILFTQKIIAFSEGNSFKYEFWSDMVSDSKYGTGKYRVSNGKLILTFDGQTAPKSYLQGKTRESSANTATFTFSVRTSPDNGNEPMVGATVIIHKASGELITGTATDANGFAQLKIAKTSKPHMLRVSYIGMGNVEHILPDTDTEFDVYLNPVFGTVYPVREEIQFRIIKISEDKVLLKDNNQTITFVAEAK